MQKMKEEVISKNSQEYRLKKIIKSTYFSVIVGAVLLGLLFIVSAWASQLSKEQLENTMYLNQYRLGSKTLTYAVQAYAVTGDQKYYDNYMKELNEDKNRDAAWYALEENSLEESEWESLREIANLSNGLVPFEEEAMQAVQDGDFGTATAYVFGADYGNTVRKINDLTDETIQQIQKRMDEEKKTAVILQAVLGILFLIGFIYIVHQNVQALKFSVQELLKPILKVSDQMIIMSLGNLHTRLDLAADDSEVGKLVTAIDTMKLNLVNIIDEISFILEQLSTGNFNVAISQKYVGEFVQIKDSMLKIVEDMRETVGTIQEASRELEEGSGQLAGAAEELARSCTAQATQVSDLMMRLDFLEESIVNDEKDAEESVKIARAAHSVLLTNSRKLTDLKVELQENTEAIVKINDILIANGREELIQEMDAVIHRGALIIGEAAADMEDVLVGAEETADRIDNVLKQLQAERQSIGQIQENIAVVAGVVDNNSAISQETAAISEEQKHQAELLVQLLNKFHI